MIATLLASQLTGSGNMPQGAAISMVLLAMIVVPLAVYVWTGRKEGQRG